MKPQAVIQNLKFLRTCLIARMKNEQVPESQSCITAILRSTLSDLKRIARKHNMPELSVLADNLYTNLAHKPGTKLRKRIFFILGAIFSLFIAFMGADVDFDLDEDPAEEKQKLKHAFLQIESAIKIVGNITGQ